ncbi:MAG: MFS transporter [Dehalococcoidia bacterium]
MPRHLLTNRTFVLLAIGQTCSNAGLWISIFSIALAVRSLSGSDFQLGLVALVRAMPMIAFSLIGGGLADRIDRRRMLSVTQPASALILAGVAISFTVVVPTDRQVILLFLATAAIGMTGAFDVPAVQASVPTIVGKDNLVRALGVLVLSRQVSSIVSPAAAGLVIGVFGFGAAFALAASMYLIFTVILQLIRWQSQPVQRSSTGLLHSIGEGIRYAWATPIILGLLLMDFVATLFAQPNAFVIIIGQDVLHLEPAQIGILATGFPVGAIAGGLALGALPGRLPATIRTVVVSTALYGTGIILFGFSPTFALSFAALVMMGVADVVSETLRSTMLQLSVPDELRGRVTSLMLIFVRGGPNLGQFRAGAISGLAGPVFSAVSGGLLCIVSVLLLGRWMMRHATPRSEASMLAVEEVR